MSKISWRYWAPGLNTGHLTLREVKDTMPAASPEEITWHVRLFENPASPVAFTGAIDLAPHDCIHVLLGRGLRGQDEAFVIGYTMGTNKDCPTWQFWVFKKLAYYFYPKPYKFRKTDLIAFDLGFALGQKCKTKNIQNMMLNNYYYLDLPIDEVRQKLGVDVRELRAAYRKEKMLVPDTFESKRLPVDARLDVFDLVNPDAPDSDWVKEK